jgi:GntR family transcriptional regulator, transcriptional repressor for pyruvate dehydrogenase complex
VVREAVAALRAEGLVETRQGVGAFVVRDIQRRPFRIDPDGLRSISEVVQVMELRTGVEVEAASLAAERASVGSRRRIASALSAIDAALARGESAIDEDFAFHQAIAAATENPHFMRFLEFLGRFLIPRQSVRIGLKSGKELRSYLERIQTEHRGSRSKAPLRCDRRQRAPRSGCNFPKRTFRFAAFHQCGSPPLIRIKLGAAERPALVTRADRIGR